MIVIHHYMRRRIPVARLFVIAILMLTFGAGYEYARQTRSFRYSATEAMWHDTGVGLLQKVWLAGTKQFRVKFATYERVLETFPEEHPLMLGRGVGMTLSTMAPGSQQNFGEYLQEYWGETSVGWGLPPTVVGGLYLDFGLGGVVCGMAAIGYILQRVYLRMRGSGRSTHVFLYAVVLTTGVKQIFGGAFVADVKPLWYLGLTAVILLACATRPARSSAGGARDHAFEVDPRRVSPARQPVSKG
jgi:oligosaccharide repeat unit polymerase